MSFLLLTALFLIFFALRTFQYASLEKSKAALSEAKNLMPFVSAD